MSQIQLCEWHAFLVLSCVLQSKQPNTGVVYFRVMTNSVVVYFRVRRSRHAPHLTHVRDLLVPTYLFLLVEGPL